MNSTMARFFAVGLALLYMGQQEACETVLEIVGVIEYPIKDYTQVLVEACAYVGTGNVLKIQKMLSHCVEEIPKPKKEEDEEEDEEEKKEEQKTEDPNDTFKDEFRSIAVLGIALIATSEPIGNDMAMRTMNHLMQLGSPRV